jgi:hypothetical protein
MNLQELKDAFGQTPNRAPPSWLWRAPKIKMVSGPSRGKARGDRYETF